jgi:hypothetical protein
VETNGLLLSVDQLVEVAMKAIQAPEYGNGNIIEVFLHGNKEKSEVSVRDVPLEALYNMGGLVSLSEGTHLISKQAEFSKQLQERGMGFD